MKILGSCATCGCEWGIPDNLYDAARHSETLSFFCPYGHSNHFPQGDSAITKLRRERDRLWQELACKDDEIAAQRRQAVAFKGQVTKLRRRVMAGVCPCCTRTFTNLQRHIKTKHPDFVSSNVVPFEKKETA